MSSFKSNLPDLNTASRECGDMHLEMMQNFERLHPRFGTILGADSNHLARAGVRYCEEYQKQHQSLQDVFREGESDYEVISRYDLNISEQHTCRRLDAQGHVIEQQSSVHKSSHHEQRVVIRRRLTMPGLHEIV